MPATKLLLAPADYDAARYAVEHWHYSHSLPSARLAIVGVWEKHPHMIDEGAASFVGAVVYTWGASHGLARSMGFEKMTDLLELARVALRKHEHPVSEIVTRATRMVADASPNVRAIVSFADPKQGHVGTIYQAMNWMYLGETPPGTAYIIDGKQRHTRQVGDWVRADTSRTSATSHLQWVREHMDPGAYIVRLPPKHRYLLPLDKSTRRRFTPEQQPYPKHADEGSTVSRLASG